jgi:hypothetical protein
MSLLDIIAHLFCRKPGLVRIAFKLIHMLHGLPLRGSINTTAKKSDLAFGLTGSYTLTVSMEIGGKAQQ